MLQAHINRLETIIFLLATSQDLDERQQRKVNELIQRRTKKDTP